ncbi:MAG: TetR/AcrR family transcriptional regulator C-terminal domain-containing protein [Mycobacterium sp.]
MGRNGREEVDVPGGTVNAVRRPYGDLDRERVVSALYELARRVGVQRVTMADLAVELGAAKPSVYYHVPGKQAALDLLAEAVLATIAEPGPGPWDRRLRELYCAARKALLEVPGIAVVLQTNGNGHTARRHDRLSRSLLGEAGLDAAAASTAHTLLYTYLLGSVSLEDSRPASTSARARRRADAGFERGLELIVAGIRATSCAQRRTGSA